MKQEGRITSDKKEVRAEQKLVQPISLILVLSNCSVRCVLILCKINYRNYTHCKVSYVGCGAINRVVEKTA